MFDNPGEQLDKAASILLVLGIIGSVIAAIAAWCVPGGFVAGLLTLVIGVAGSYVGALSLKTIADTAQSVDATQRVCNQNKKKLQELETKVTAQNTATANAPKPPREQPAPAETETVKKVAQPLPAKKEESIPTKTCPHCGASQFASRKKCFRCGETLD